MSFRGGSKGDTDGNVLKAFQMGPSKAKQFLRVKRGLFKRFVKWVTGESKEEEAEENTAEEKKRESTEEEARLNR